jgi:hypothetical protein
VTLSRFRKEKDFKELPLVGELVIFPEKRIKVFVKWLVLDRGIRLE